MTSCPGRKYSGISGRPERSLDRDLEAIGNWGAEILVSLIEEREYPPPGMHGFVSALPEGMEHLVLPIKDMGIPDSSWERNWAQKGSGIREVLARGGKVCIHCMGGMGRTGMVAARLLVEFGLDPESAIVAVRRTRPGAIETESQAAYIRSLDPEKITVSSVGSD